MGGRGGREERVRKRRMVRIMVRIKDPDKGQDNGQGESKVHGQISPM
jgi:hypothetical protein